MRIVRTKEYADYRKIKVQSARIERMRGGGPPFFRVSDSLNAPVYYDLNEVDHFFASRPRFRSTGEEKAALHAKAASTAGA